MKLLLIEDDQPTGSALAELLTAQHYIVNLVTDGQTGLELAREFAYDLIVLDVGVWGATEREMHLSVLKSYLIVP